MTTERSPFMRVHDGNIAETILHLDQPVLVLFTASW